MMHQYLAPSYVNNPGIRSRRHGLRSDEEGDLNRRISNKEPRNVEGK